MTTLDPKKKNETLKLLESLEEWHIAKKLDLLDIDDILDYLFRYPEHINSIRLFLDIVNTQDVSLRDKKLVDFILSFNDEDYLAFINIVSVDSKKIVFFNESENKSLNNTKEDGSQYLTTNPSKKLNSEFASRIIYLTNVLFNTKSKALPDGLRLFKIYRYALQTLKNENNYSVEKFEELIKPIYTLKSKTGFELINLIEPTKRFKATVSKRLKKLKGWDSALQSDHIDTDVLAKYFFNYSNNVKSIQIFLDLINSKDSNSIDRKLLEFITSFEIYKLNGLIDLIFEDKIIFFTDQEKVLKSRFSKKIMSTLCSFIEKSLHDGNFKPLVELICLLKILIVENQLSVKRFEELYRYIEILN